MYPKIQVIINSTEANTNRCKAKSVITSRNRLKVTTPPNNFAATEPDFRNDLNDAPKIIKMNADTIKNHAFRVSFPTKRKPSSIK